MQEIELEKFVKDITLGYFYIYLPKHELANASGKVYMHRYVASLKLGRLVTSNEHVHHVDEDRGNNSPDNLEVLSAEEHAIQHMRERFPPVQVFCSHCGIEFMCPLSRYNKSISGKLFCSENCNTMYSRKFEVDRDALLDLVWTYPTTKVAKILGVSDTAVSKRCKKLEIPKPPRGYWAKVAAGKPVE